MRLITCKEGECNRSVIQAQRREPSQLWKFLVLVAMCTKIPSLERKPARERCSKGLVWSGARRWRTESVNDKCDLPTWDLLAPPASPGSP